VPDEVSKQEAVQSSVAQNFPEQLVLPPHLQLTEDEWQKTVALVREAGDEVQGTVSYEASKRRTKVVFGAPNRYWVGGSVLKGGYVMIVQYMMTQFPDFPGCQQINKRRQYSGVMLECFKHPRYVGESLEEAAALLTKYKRIKVVNHDLRFKLFEYFGQIIREDGSDGHLIVYGKPGLHEKRVASRKANRIKRGLVPHRWVIDLYSHALAQVSMTYAKAFRVTGWWYPRKTTDFLERCIQLVKATEKLGIKMNVKSLEKFKPYIPGLLKHEDPNFRRFGRWLRTKFKRKEGT